jgi:hypothetical protein
MECTVTVTGVLQPLTQRGNRRKSIFFGGDDSAPYRDWLAEYCAKFGDAERDLKSILLRS